MADTITNTQAEPATQYQCRHIFTDGHRCLSPCLRREEFCYYHHTTRKPIANPGQRQARRGAFQLPLPEDRSAIQASIGEVLQRIASNDIDPRRAGLLLYGLQIASLNLPKPPRESRPAATPAPQPVEDFITDPELGDLAPRAEVGSTTQRPSSVEKLLMKLLNEKEAATPAPPSNKLPAKHPPHTQRPSRTIHRIHPPLLSLLHPCPP